MYSWNWPIIWQYKRVFMEGASITVWLALLSILAGTALGLVLAMAKGSQNPVFRTFARWHTNVFRALPTLVVLVWIYYALPATMGIRLSPFLAAVTTLALHLSAFVSETIRACVESVPKGQLESGMALGMTHRQAMWNIVVPQAVRTMVPNLMGLYITEIKNSSLASVIGVNEILHRTNIVISETYRPLELYTAVALSYAAIIVPVALFARWSERRLSVGIAHASLHHDLGIERA